jgi:gliding motility-associated-like protein
MRPIILKLFLLALSVAFGMYANAQPAAQTCTGSLGDPVINQDFGSGANPGVLLPYGVTNMQYVSSNCPNDGQYTIANSLINENGCHPDTWHDVPTDHTGNPNGYMMIVNASEQPSIFFTQTANGLCPNTRYFFSAYILNLITLRASGPGVNEPDITFSIKTTSGQVLAIDSTGSIPATDSLKWYNYGVFFTTPANVTDVVVVMTNNAPGGNGNDLVLDDITFRACGPIIEAGFASVTGSQENDICQGQSFRSVLKAGVIGNDNPSYQWQKNYHGAGWVDIAGENANSLNINFINSDTGTYKFRVGVGNGSGIGEASCRIYSRPLVLAINPLPVVPAIQPQTVCEGNTIVLAASGGAAYLWSGPGVSNSTQNPIIINNVTSANAGTYTVIASSDKGCAAPPVQTTVTVVPKVNATISDSIAICAGESTQLKAAGGTVYKWTPSTGLDHDDIADPVAAPLQTTTYFVAVSNGGCTDSSRSVTVKVMQNPVANAGGNKVIFEGQSVKLNGTVKGDNITGYYWTPATGLDDPTSLAPTATPTDNITYTLHVNSQSCGMSSDTAFVRVYKKIAIPNAFTPNNDGINDFWDIQALITYPESLTQVFDRYGQKVYQSTGYAIPWDGKLKGSLLPTGTYYYIIDLKNNTPKLAGWVLIVR